MVTDQQVKLYLLERKKGRRQDAAASRAAMSERTGRKYEQLGQMPSEARKEHSWRTRPDSFEEYWPWIKEQLDLNPGLEAKTLFEALQRQHPGKLQDGQLRTFQRRVRRWRAEEGPDKEIFFDQQYRPGEISESDFTSMNSLQVTVAGEAFPHLLYHFVLPYSNWETGSICFTESFESLSEGLQKGLWYLTGVPQFHQTDCLSAAVAKPRARKDEEAFTPRYDALMKHYRLTPKRTQPASPHENGDIEQRHHRFKRALDQRLMLRGSRNFTDRGAYEQFLQELFQELNAGRQQRFLEELETLQKLPERKLDCFKRVEARVGRGSIIHVLNNTYSVPSRLIGEKVQVRVHADNLEVWFGQKHVETIPRLQGRQHHHINYRHIIHWLVRKPGAFQNYRYREALFPSSHFRMTYDWLRQRRPATADKEYLRILELAARENETTVDDVLRHLFNEGHAIAFEHVEAIVQSAASLPPATSVNINPVNLSDYDSLLGNELENES